MIRTVSITVSGKVQGVWYRKYTSDKARELGVRGTVQNLNNGNVLIQATGTDEQIKELESWCWKGSPLSEVTNVKRTESDSKSFSGFRIIG